MSPIRVEPLPFHDSDDPVDRMRLRIFGRIVTAVDVSVEFQDLSKRIEITLDCGHTQEIAPCATYTEDEINNLIGSRCHCITCGPESSSQ